METITVCRICLKFLKIDQGVSLIDKANTETIDMLMDYFPAVCLLNIQNPVMCDKCVDSLIVVTNFKLMFLQTEDKLKHLIRCTYSKSLRFWVQMSMASLKKLTFDEVFSLRRHRGLGRQTHVCPTCERKYSSLGFLASHVEKTHICPNMYQTVNTKSSDRSENTENVIELNSNARPSGSRGALPLVSLPVESNIQPVEEKEGEKEKGAVRESSPLPKFNPDDFFN